MARPEKICGVPSWLTSRLVLISLFFFVTACADDGCDCEGFEQADYPEEHYDKTLPRGGQVRVTESGLDFLEGQIPSLIEEVQPGGLSFCVPRDTSGNPEMCVDDTCDDGSNGCQVDLAIDDSSIEPVPSDTIDVGLTVGGLGGQDDDGNWEDVIDFEYDATIGTADCVVHFWEDGGAESDPASIDAGIPITLSLDDNAETNDLRIEVGEIDMEDVTDQIDYELTGGWECDGADWFKGLFEGTINDEVRDMLEETVAEMEADQLCRACGDGEPSCPGNSSCQEYEGTDSCVYDDDTCVPRLLGMEGNLMLGELLEGYGEEPDAATHVMGRAADHAEVNTGINLGLRTGAQPAEESRCIPIDDSERPSFDEVEPSPEIYADKSPSDDPFMIGIGLHRRAIEHAFWSTWGSGALCLGVGSDDIGQLSSDGLGVFLPSLQDLAGYGAKANLRIVPQEPPTVELGENTVTEDGDSYAIDDPLMTIDWDSVDLHFYVYAHERFVRAFGLRTDITLPIAVSADGEGEIEPVIGDLEDSVENIRAVRSELLEEDTDELIDLVPTLIGTAAPSLADSIAEPIELPEFVGYQIAIDQEDITSVDKNKSIALFADLVEADAEALVSPLSPRILRTDLDIDRPADSRVPRPTAYVDVGADTGGMGEDNQLEYSWRVDDGLWSMWERSDQLAIDDPVLALQGEHQIDVRTRLRGAPETTSRDVASTDIVVDYTGPELTLERDGPRVEVDARDVVDDPDQIEVRHRLEGDFEADWSDWSSADAIDLREIDAPTTGTLVVQARDRAGHTTEETKSFRWQPNNHDDEAAPNEADTDEPSAGCQSTDSSAPAAGLFLLLALALLVWRRRRRISTTGGAVLLAACLIAAAGCKDDTASTEGGECGDECAEDEECIDEACYPEDELCEEDADCECNDNEAASCNDDGICECTTICEDDCGDDGFCCHESESCESVEDLCEDYECDEGFEPESRDDPAPDVESCDPGGDACECVSLPPLDLGRHGPYAAAAESDGVRAVSVYNKTYGDLMVGLVDDEETIEWHFVDGVPESGDVEGALDGPRGGISDPGDDVGTHTSIAIDDDGALHVLYRDEDEATLEYARGIADGDDYTFETTTLDDDGDTGHYTSALVDDGALHAVYTSAEVESDGDGWQSQLRHVNFPVDAELDDLDLEPEIIHATDASNPCGSDCEGDEECFVADASCVEPTDDCDGDCDDDQECREGSCEDIYDEGYREYPEVAGFSNQLTTTEDGLAVTFSDNTRDRAGWSERSDDQWAEAEFLDEPSGPYVSGAFDEEGDLHLAYMDTEERTLVYEEVGQVEPETIADGVRDTDDGYIQADIGEDATLRLDGEGTPQVLYQDATWHRLFLAERQEADDWSTETISEPDPDSYEGSGGFFAAMPTDPADSWLAVEYAIDNQADEPTGEARIQRLP